MNLLDIILLTISNPLYWQKSEFIAYFFVIGLLINTVLNFKILFVVINFKRKTLYNILVTSIRFYTFDELRNAIKNIFCMLPDYIICLFNYVIPNKNTPKRFILEKFHHLSENLLGIIFLSVSNQHCIETNLIVLLVRMSTLYCYVVEIA